MKIELQLPEMGEDGPEEGEISYWMVDVDEEFNEGDDLVEILTDKATFNVPAPAAGKLVEILVQEGDTARVGQTLAVIESEEENQ